MMNEKFRHFPKSGIFNEPISQEELEKKIAQGWAKTSSGDKYDTYTHPKFSGYFCISDAMIDITASDSNPRIICNF